MSPQKKRIYLILIAVSGVAWLVDRCFLAGASPAPVRAQARPGPSRTPPAKAASLSASESARPTTPAFIPELPFPRGLPLWDPSVPMRDLFRGPAESAAPNPDTPDIPEPTSLARTFAATHKLEAVLVQEGLTIAIIDGRWLRPGDRIAGCTFTDAEANRARLRCANVEVVLELSHSVRTPNR